MNKRRSRPSPNSARCAAKTSATVDGNGVVRFDAGVLTGPNAASRALLPVDRDGPSEEIDAVDREAARLISSDAEPSRHGDERPVLARDGASVLSGCFFDYLVSSGIFVFGPAFLLVSLPASKGTPWPSEDDQPLRSRSPETNDDNSRVGRADTRRHRVSRCAARSCSPVLVPKS